MSKVKWIGAVVAVILLALTTGGPTLAGKGGKGKPGGGGGGDTGGQPCTILNLGPGRALAVNDLGEAIGGTNDTLAAYWSVDASNNVTQQILPDFGLAHSWADDLNNSGQAVGVVGNGVDNAARAVVWSNLGTPQVSVQYLGEPTVPTGIVPFSHARAINSDGLIAGQVEFRDEKGNLSSAGRVAVVWQPNGSGYDVIELPGSLSAHAWDINDHGEIVGRLLADPVLWQLQFDNDGVISGVTGPSVLTSLGGPSGSAVGINNAGVIVGNSDINADETHAVRWQIDESGSATETTDLGILPKMDFATGARVNSAGVIVGSSSSYNFKSGQSKRDGVLYQNGSMQSLTSLLSYGPFDTINSGIDINELNWICGRADVNFVSHAFIAIPNE
jgi:probable HAF family extracellular repeat protein